MVLKLVEISEIIVGELIGNGAIEIYGVSGIEEARKNEITFLANPKYRFAMKNTQASAVIVGKGVSANGSKSLIRVDNPYHAFIAVLKIFSEGEQCPKPGISSLSLMWLMLWSKPQNLTSLENPSTLGLVAPTA